MARLLTVFRALFREAVLTMIQYRAESFLWAIWGIVYPVVTLAMWEAAARDPVAASPIGTYPPGTLAGYFLVTMVVGHVTTTWDAFEMGYFVRTGQMSVWLTQPMLPLWRAAAVNAAWKLFTLTILVPIWVLVAWAIAPRFEGGAAHVALGVIALVLAAGIAFIWGYVIALAAFWTTRTDAIAEFWFGGALLLGGRLAPLDLLPGALQVLAAALPFQWMMGFPTDVLIGRESISSALGGLGWQTVWLATGLAVYVVVWGAAVRRYSAVGG